MARVARPRGLKAQVPADPTSGGAGAVEGNRSAECAYYDELDLSGTVGMFTLKQNEGQDRNPRSEVMSFLPALPTPGSKGGTPLQSTKLEEHLKKRLEERDRQISVLTAENEELAAQCTSSRLAADRLQKELDELAAHLKTKTRQLVEKTGQLETEKMITADLLEKFESLQTDYVTLQAENAVLRRKLESASGVESGTLKGNYQSEFKESDVNEDDNESSLNVANKYLCAGRPNSVHKIQAMQTIAKQLSLDDKDDCTPKASPERPDNLSLHSDAGTDENGESYIDVSKGTSNLAESNSKASTIGSVSKPSDFLGTAGGDERQQQQQQKIIHSYTTYPDGLSDHDNSNSNGDDGDSVEGDHLYLSADYVEELKPSKITPTGKSRSSPDKSDPTDDASYSEMYCSKEKSRNASQIADLQYSEFNASMSPHALSHAAELELIVNSGGADDCVQPLQLNASIVKGKGVRTGTGSHRSGSNDLTLADSNMPTEIRISKLTQQVSPGDNSISSSGLDSLVLGTLRQAAGNTYSKPSHHDNENNNGITKSHYAEQQLASSGKKPASHADHVDTHGEHDQESPYEQDDNAESDARAPKYGYDDEENESLLAKRAGAGVALEILFDDNPKRQLSHNMNQKLINAQNQRVHEMKERRAQMRQRELDEAAEHSDMAHMRSSSGIIGSPPGQGNRRSMTLNRRSARPRGSRLHSGAFGSPSHGNQMQDSASTGSNAHPEKERRSSSNLNQQSASYVAESTEPVYKPITRPNKSAASVADQVIGYLPPAKFDNSSIVQKLILHNLLPGSANYERRMVTMDNVSKDHGHLLLVLRDTERKSYHSCVKVDEINGGLIKVDGPDNMPNELAQSIIESMLKYDSSSRTFQVVDQRQLSTLVVAITLKVRRKKVSGR